MIKYLIHFRSLTLICLYLGGRIKGWGGGGGGRRISALVSICIQQRSAFFARLTKSSKGTRPKPVCHSRIRIHLSTTTSLLYFPQRWRHSFKGTRPSFSGFLDTSQCCSSSWHTRFENDSALREPIGDPSPPPCSEAGCWTCQAPMLAMPHLRVGGSGPGEAAEADERRRGGTRGVNRRHQRGNYGLLISKEVCDRGRCRFPSCAMWPAVNGWREEWKRGKKRGGKRAQRREECETV